MIVAVILLAFLLFMLKQASENNILFHEVTLNGEKEKVSLFFISDVHLRKINQKMLRKIDGKIDAVIIGGDLADKRTPTSRIYDNIRLLQNLGPIYFVWGNNDREVGEDNLRKIFDEMNVTILENDSTLIPSLRNRCWLSAIDDTSTKNARYNQAFEKCGKMDHVFFISHNPEVFSYVRRKYKAKIMMGGHLHGGQIRFGPYGIHPHGSFSMREGVATLISNGYGTTAIPLRFGAKPQCHIIDVRFEGENNRET
ncbi:serine/threonine protein phosphatase [Ureibacillus sinduriensis BLB-1 = JCM 15800]|uniref:Serine/threonine protein phosphatase n=1 Tax=Ureibacillus sinduriensis BLB-1 = JCM 15800 TaxID=1384057 RepID=A0A0A3IH03_9BACL|nr:serine/threonine protein phosphatase [Ureibacillus sinduriensis BLB-1 = JCM 15800]